MLNFVAHSPVTCGQILGPLIGRTVYKYPLKKRKPLKSDDCGRTGILPVCCGEFGSNFSVIFQVMLYGVLREPNPSKDPAERPRRMSP